MLTAEDLCGVWHLTNVETIEAGGSKRAVSLFGPSPEGMIMYDRSGWMSVQIQRSWSDAVEERLAGYSAYCGRWTFDEPAQIVSHFIEWATYPRERGMVLQRSVSGSRLEMTLSTEPMPDEQGARNHLSWRLVSGV